MVYLKKIFLMQLKVMKTLQYTLPFCVCRFLIYIYEHLLSALSQEEP